MYFFLVTYSTQVTHICIHKYSVTSKQSGRLFWIFLLIFPGLHLILICLSLPPFCTAHIPAIIYTADYCPCPLMIKYCDKINTAIKWIKASSISSQCVMSEAGILPCLYDTRPPVNSGKRKQRQPAYKTRRPPQIQVFMGIKTTGVKSDLKRDCALHWEAMLCPVLSLHPLMTSFGIIYVYVNVCISSDLIFTQEACFWLLSFSKLALRIHLISSRSPLVKHNVSIAVAAALIFRRHNDVLWLCKSVVWLHIQ